MKYILQGKVMRGDGYGRELGYPTANLSRHNYMRLRQNIPFGVYAGYAEIDGSQKKYNTAIVIGPNDKRGRPKLEAHCIGFRANLYGQKMRLETVKFIRPLKKFENEGELKKQIARDIQKILRCLS